MSIKIASGSKHKWRERTVEIDGQQSAGVVSARDCTTGERLDVPVNELRSATSKAPPIRLNAVSEADWLQAKLARSLLEPYINAARVPKGVMRDAATRCDRSVRQMRRYLKALRVTPLTTTLVPKRPGRKAHSQLLSSKVERVIANAIRRYYLRREPLTVKAVHDRIARACRLLRLQVPKYNTVLRRVDAWDAREVMVARRGSKAANQQHQARVGSLRVDSPLELIQMDHTRVDVHIVSDDSFREWLGRPWLTVCIDVYSRAVVGFYLSIDAPSALSVAMAVSHTILAKEPWLKQRDIDVPWPMHGRPTKILCDNAAEFRGTAAARGCDQLGIILEFRPVARPHWGGHIERLIGTLMGHVHCLPGTSFSNTGDREDYASTKKACMTLSQLEQWLIYEICLNYHVSKHRGIGIAPLQKWNSSVQASKTSQEVM